MATPTLPVPCPDSKRECLTVIFMDAGQGDSTLIVYPDNSLTLIDCGSKKNSKIVSVEINKVLTAYLSRTNNTLKSMVLTHPDGDHFCLVKDLIINKNVKVGELFYGGLPDQYGDISGWIKQKGTNPPATVTGFGKSGQKLEVPSLSYKSDSKPYSNVAGRILAANVGDPKVKTDANPNSVVVLLTYGDINIFLMGDATTQTEEFILKWDDETRYLRKLLTDRHTALKAGHHGSDTSSGSEWIDRIRPEVVFISSDTRTFSGTSIPVKNVIDRIFAEDSVVELFPNEISRGKHSYIQYNKGNQRHEAQESTKAMCTTLHAIEFDNKAKTEFTAYGTSWYYTVARNEKNSMVYITPACGWDDVNVDFENLQ